jgi:hypothetical protein
LLYRNSPHAKLYPLHLCWCCRYQSSLGNKRIELFDTGTDQVADKSPVQMASGGHQ